jgi:hypothetical protein
MKLIALICALACFSAQAIEMKILDVLNDIDTETNEFIVDLDDQNNIKRFYKDTFQGTRHLERETYEIKDVLHKGIVLEKRKGLNAITLHAKEFNPKATSKLEIRYLTNGMTGNRESKFIQLKKDYSNKWVINSMDNEVITKMEVVANRRMRMLIGIRDIILN